MIKSKLRKQISHDKTWGWYGVWSKTLLKPTPKMLSSLLAQKEVTFRQSFYWLLVSATIYVFLGKISNFMRHNEIIDLAWLGFFFLDIIFKTFELIGSILLFCALVHIIAKYFFKKKGSFTDFFIAYSAILSPILIIWSMPVFLWIVFLNYFALGVGFLLGVYWMFYSGALAIKSVYNFSWGGSLLMNFLVVVTLISLSVIIYLALNPNIHFPF
jgi:hypothetical protein